VIPGVRRVDVPYFRTLGRRAPRDGFEPAGAGALPRADVREHVLHRPPGVERGIERTRVVDLPQERIERRAVAPDVRHEFRLRHRRRDFAATARALLAFRAAGFAPLRAPFLAPLRSPVFVRAAGFAAPLRRAAGGCTPASRSGGSTCRRYWPV